MLDRIRTNRRVQGLDKRDISDRRLTLAISRVPNLEKYVSKANIVKEKKLRGLIE